jgi:hypothetical protein
MQKFLRLRNMAKIFITETVVRKGTSDYGPADPSEVEDAEVRRFAGTICPPRVSLYGQRPITDILYSHHSYSTNMSFSELEPSLSLLVI